MKQFVHHKYEDLIEPTYPIGSDMVSVMQTLSAMYKYFKEYVPSNWQTKKEIVLWCRGSSGAIFAGLLASKLYKSYHVTIQHVKKKGENSHGGPNRYDANKYNVIIDDFVSSGNTVYKITEEIYKACPRNTSPKVDLLLVGGAIIWYSDETRVPIHTVISNRLSDNEDDRRRTETLRFKLFDHYYEKKHKDELELASVTF